MNWTIILNLINFYPVHLEHVEDDIGDIYIDSVFTTCMQALGCITISLVFHEVGYCFKFVLFCQIGQILMYKGFLRLGHVEMALRGSYD